jgi:hypothetical protein
MDIFNLKSNDVKDFKRFMDMKAASFGGPTETEAFDKSKRKSLKNWTNVAQRDANFENGGKNHNYDGYWKAFNSDLPSRAAKIKVEEPLSAIPTMGVKIVKESHVPQFENYVFEEEADETDVELDEAPEIDEEALEMFMEEFSDELKEILEIACEKMEIEKEECVEIFKAAIQKVSEMPEEEESDEELEENFDTITESEDSEETYATYDFEKDGHMAIFAYPHHNGKDTKDSLRDWKNKDSDKRTVKFVDDYREAQAGVLRLKKASKE